MQYKEKKAVVLSFFSVQSREKQMHSVLSLKDFQLPVRIGYLAEERQIPQLISLDIHIIFKCPPRACHTDQLADSICYASIANMAREICSAREFHLIEHLAHVLYAHIKSHCGKKNTLTIGVRKCFPPILDLKGGASFYYGDGNKSWLL